jgi:hypothetical protein
VLRRQPVPSSERFGPRLPTTSSALAAWCSSHSCTYRSVVPVRTARVANRNEKLERLQISVPSLHDVTLILCHDAELVVSRGRALGILGIVAMGRRGGFREATVIAVTLLGVGVTVVHVMDVIESGNLASGNTIQNVSNLLRPGLLIAFLAASRRAERSPDSEAHTSTFIDGAVRGYVQPV